MIEFFDVDVVVLVCLIMLVMCGMVSMDFLVVMKEGSVFVNIV